MMSDCGTYTTHATPQRRGRNSIISEEQHESDEKKPLRDHHDKRGENWGKIYERQVFPRLSEKPLELDEDYLVNVKGKKKLKVFDETSKLRQ